jgi:hopene-associated glycosyltransferase HpnB
MIALALAGLSLAIWIYLIAARGGFWRCAERDGALAGPDPARWPALVAVVPARDEAETVAKSVGSLLAQDYPGRFAVVLVDDQSVDGTAQLARAAAAAHNTPERLKVVRGSDLPAGWTGKLWAMRQGLAHAGQVEPAPDYVLFCDADIAFAPGMLRRLVAGAVARRTVLTSVMARLACASPAEQWLVPAFVFFFQKLYPFSWVNDPRRATAAAAGGCMLVRREALLRTGGIEAIRGALIDDCALGALMKRQGPVWLGLSDDVASLRPYPALRDIRAIVVRSAYAQLGYSPLMLAGAVAGMVLTYLVPPAFALFGFGFTRVFGAAAWLLMALAYLPMLRFYRQPAWRALALPAVAALYTAFTLESAWRHWRGGGGEWKGRIQAGLARDATGA